MSTELVAQQNALEVEASQWRQFVTMHVGDQRFGVTVRQVNDILRPQRITPIPLAGDIVRGSINLRGRIVTVIDMRQRLGLPLSSNPQKHMQVVVTHEEELFALVVDAVGEVLTLSTSQFESNPSNLSQEWQQVSQGVYRLDNHLLVVLDVTRLLNFD